MIGKQLLSTSGLLALLCGALAMTCLAADRELTPESLAMPRWQIAFSRGGMIRLFNGRGGICIRDKTVTGLESLSFVPATLPGYRFGLAFREEGSGRLLRDVVDDAQESFLQKGGLHPLGMNRNEGPLVVLLQDAIWRPNQFRRTGTFHKRLQGRWISLGLTTRASVSAEADEVYLELELENRQDEPLRLTVLPEQRVGLPGDVAESVVSTLQSGKFQVTVVSDLGDPRGGGWPMEIAARQKRTARFAIVVQKAGAPTPPLHAADLAARIQRADDAVCRRLRWASAQLPRVTTENGALDEFYRRCVLSVVESRWQRADFGIHPFYAIGNLAYCVAWDTSFSSEMLAVLDPDGLRSTFWHTSAPACSRPVGSNGTAKSCGPGTRKPLSPSCGFSRITCDRRATRRCWTAPRPASRYSSR